MDTLPAILALEEERKKRRKRSNLMVAEDSGRPTKKAKGPHDDKGKQFKHGNQFKNKMHFKHGKKTKREHASVVAKLGIIRLHVRSDKRAMTMQMMVQRMTPRKRFSLYRKP